MSYRNLFLVFFVATIGFACTQPESNSTSTAIQPSDIKKHISYLASDSLAGRETGTEGEDLAGRYIADHFENFGLKPGGGDGSYLQHFTVNMSILNNPHQPGSDEFTDEDRPAENVIGIIQGSEQPNTYIVIGAHYDHLGTGKFGSLYTQSDSLIHNGADDNASGTAGMLELAEYFSEHQPKKSLVLIGFSGEEMGLLGSQYFVENPTIPLNGVQAMINMDMIGRMDGKLIILGTGSSEGWRDLITNANTDSLNIETVPDGTGASDHTSFYNQKIPVLHYFTDTHSNYHRPSDDVEYINFEGEAKVLNHIKNMIVALDTIPRSSLTYKEAPSTQNRTVTLDGPTLGVTPDYGFSGKGMRITGVRSDGPAGNAGLQSGDVIIKLAGKDLEDIYDYMEVLNTLSNGDQTTVTVLRDGDERTFDLNL